MEVVKKAEKVERLCQELRELKSVLRVSRSSVDRILLTDSKSSVRVVTTTDEIIDKVFEAASLRACEIEHKELPNLLNKDAEDL